MPRAPSFKIKPLAELLRQLEYAPPETRRRHMDAAEKLVSEIEPNRAYPREFVTFRITGYRPDEHEMLTFAGGALRTDLANLVQRLSSTLELPSKRDGHAALTMNAVAKTLGVSAKTVQRYRSEGLVCHVVVVRKGVKRLSCYEDALARFAGERKTHLARAAKFTRISDDTEAIIVEEARKMRAAKPISLSAAAKIIARRHGRAHETIRQMLRKHDRGAETPIFDAEREGIDAREIAVMHRAWMRGVDLGPIAKRFDRSRPAILRAINRHRTELLRGLRIHAVEMPTFAMEGADAVILSAPAVSENLLALPPHDDAFKLLDWASVSGGMETLDESVEDALLGGWNYLKGRAVKGIAGLPRDEAPTSETVDAIETDLRWATRLHRRLVLLSFPAALRRIELNLGRSLIAQPAEQIASMIRLAAGVIREALESVDPSRGQRLERIVSFAMERELAQRPSQGASSSPRAAARHAATAAIPLRSVFDGLDEWESWLEPWQDVRDATSRMTESSRALLVQRFGWDGRPPCTMIAIAKKEKCNQPVIARRMQKAIRELRAAVRVEVVAR